MCKLGLKLPGINTLLYACVNACSPLVPTVPWPWWYWCWSRRAAAAAWCYAAASAPAPAARCRRRPPRRRPPPPAPLPTCCPCAPSPCLPHAHTSAHAPAHSAERCTWQPPTECSPSTYIINSNQITKRYQNHLNGTLKIIKNKHYTKIKHVKQLRASVYGSRHTFSDPIRLRPKHTDGRESDKRVQPRVESSF